MGMKVFSHKLQKLWWEQRRKSGDKESQSLRTESLDSTSGWLTWTWHCHLAWLRLQECYQTKLRRLKWPQSSCQILNLGSLRLLGVCVAGLVTPWFDLGFGQEGQKYKHSYWVCLPALFKCYVLNLIFPLPIVLLSRSCACFWTLSCVNKTLVVMRERLLTNRISLFPRCPGSQAREQQPFFPGTKGKYHHKTIPRKHKTRRIQFFFFRVKLKLYYRGCF